MKKFIIGTTLSLMVAASAFIGVKAQAEDVYRLYNSNTGEHFYTKNTYERSSLIQNGWNSEGKGLDGMVHHLENLYIEFTIPTLETEITTIP
jgi:hypothetical protein